MHLTYSSSPKFGHLIAVIMTSKRGQLQKRLADTITSHPDFPIPGILFRDIMPVLLHPDLLDELCAQIVDEAKSTNIPVTAVVALDSRGFLFGPEVALRLKVPFVPICKPGKIRGPSVEETYQKEYGKDAVAITDGALPANAGVLIIDDLLATGGTMAAAINLVRKLNCSVALTFCVIELTALNGRALLPTDVPVSCLLQL